MGLAELKTEAEKIRDELATPMTNPPKVVTLNARLADLTVRLIEHIEQKEKR